MKPQEIEITIDAEGNVAVEVHGAPSKSCLDLTGPLEEALGGDVASRRFTSEYYETTPAIVPGRRQTR